MLIPLQELVDKYNIKFTGILHVGAHQCEEISDYDRYLQRKDVLWIEAMPDKVAYCKMIHNNILIERAVASDKVETVKFNISNNGQSSSFLEFGIHKIHHPHVHYIHSYQTETVMLKDVINKYPINYNFINLDIQGAELKALKGMSEYLNQVDYIYTEVNDDYVYENCALVTEIDDYLKHFGFKRVETKWCSNFHWGDAFYIKDPDLVTSLSISPSPSPSLISISLCIPTLNRFDTFLSNNLEKYIEYLNNGIIDELIVSDEDGVDYNKIANKFYKDLNENKKFRIYKNEKVLGVFLNKLKVSGYASNKYIALIDSDNFADANYFNTIKKYIYHNQHTLPENVILSPSLAKPNFNYKQYQNMIITKENIKNYRIDCVFQTLMNTGNYVISQPLLKNIHYNPVILDQIAACDVLYFNILLFQQHTNFEFHVLENLEYEHIVHLDSEYLKKISKCEEMRNKFVYPEFFTL